MGIYIYRNNQVEGPFDDLVIQQALANKTMGMEEMCCLEGTQEWHPARALFPPPTPIVFKRNLPMTIGSSGSSGSSIGGFFRRLTKIDIVVLTLSATVIGGFLILFGLANLVAPALRENLQRLPEGRLAEINRRDAEIEQRSKALVVQFAGIMGAVAQIEENKRSGYYVPSEDTERVMQRYMAFMIETTQLDDERKKLAAERAELRKTADR